jgi:hypothetical protein
MDEKTDEKTIRLDPAQVRRLVETAGRHPLPSAEKAEDSEA